MQLEKSAMNPKLMCSRGARGALQFSYFINFQFTRLWVWKEISAIRHNGKELYWLVFISYCAAVTRSLRVDCC